MSTCTRDTIDHQGLAKLLRGWLTSWEAAYAAGRLEPTPRGKRPRFYIRKLDLLAEGFPPGVMDYLTEWAVVSDNGRLDAEALGIFESAEAGQPPPSPSTQKIREVERQIHKGWTRLRDLHKKAGEAGPKKVAYAVDIGWTDGRFEHYFPDKSVEGFELLIKRVSARKG